MKTKIGTWRGKPVEELNKEELLEVVRFLGQENVEMKKKFDVQFSYQSNLKQNICGY